MGDWGQDAYGYSPGEYAKRYAKYWKAERDRDSKIKKDKPKREKMLRDTIEALRKDK